MKALLGSSCGGGGVPVVPRILLPALIAGALTLAFLAGTRFAPLAPSVPPALVPRPLLHHVNAPPMRDDDGSAATTATAASVPTSCDYFFGADKWLGGKDVCNISLALKHSADAAAQGGCLPASASRDGCPLRPRMLVTHTWFETFDFDDESAMRKASLLIRAWMLTQDLRRSRLVIWASRIVLPTSGGGGGTPQWFTQFAPYATIRVFDYDAEVASTPLALSQHFSTWARFTNNRTHEQQPLALQSDVVRNVLLHNHGGLYVDTDAVPLRDLWDLTAGLGLNWIPKFFNFIANSHLMYVRCPRSALARRRLEHMTLFVPGQPSAWPKNASVETGDAWVYNDALSDHVRASQALRFNLTEDAQEIRAYRALPASAWEDLEVPLPITWFDSWWACHGPPPYNETSDFFRRTACEGVYVWHRLTKHREDDEFELGKHSGATEFWREIYEGDTGYDYKRIRLTPWGDVRPRVLTGGLNCSSS